MMEKIKTLILKAIGVYDYDRVGEARILKAISLYKSGGKINKLRAWRFIIKILIDIRLILDLT